MNEKHMQLRHLAERAPKGDWRLDLDAVTKGGSSIPLDVGIGTPNFHGAVAEFVWTMEDDCEAMLGPSSIAARNTAYYVAAASPNAVLSLLDRIDLLERTLRHAGYTITEDGAEPPTESTIPMMSLALQEAHSRIASQDAFIEVMTEHVRDVAALAAQSVEIAARWGKQGND